MREYLTCAPLLVFGLSCSAQSSPQSVPQDPQAIFAAAEPFYDFNSAELKPWHLKATYQLYNQSGKPAENGTFEYWRSSPKVRRSSWTRPSADRTDWHSSDGTHSYRATGEKLSYFERLLPSLLFAPLPSAHDLDSGKTRIELHERLSNGTRFPCVTIIALNGKGLSHLSQSEDPIYCFDPQMPDLRASYTFGEVITDFNNIAKFQGRFLAREIEVSIGGRKVFSAAVENVTGLIASDPALAPDPDAKQLRVENLCDTAGTMISHLIKKQAPVYPLDAIQRRQQGTVLIQVTIGTDGRVRDPEVAFTPSPTLAAAAVDAVSHWEYEPTTVNGVPVETDTMIRIIFLIGD